MRNDSISVWNINKRVTGKRSVPDWHRHVQKEKKILVDNLLVRIHFIIKMIEWTGPASWAIEFPFPGSLISTFLDVEQNVPSASLNKEIQLR